MTDQFKKKWKTLTCALIRVVVRETEFPGNHTETAGTENTVSSNPSEDISPFSPLQGKCVTCDHVYFMGLNVNDGNWLKKSCNGSVCWDTAWPSPRADLRSCLCNMTQGQGNSPQHQNMTITEELSFQKTLKGLLHRWRQSIVGVHKHATTHAWGLEAQNRGKDWAWGRGECGLQHHLLY